MKKKTNMHQVFSYIPFVIFLDARTCHVGNINGDLTPEAIEDSTAGFCLKIQGKTLYLTPLLAMKKFRKRGNKEGALSAFHKLEQERLGKLRTQEGSKGPTSVSTTNTAVIN